MNKSIKIKIFGWTAFLILLASTPIIASQIGDLINFQNGSVADADQVNQNFTDLKNAINDNAAQIEELKTLLNVGSNHPGSIVAAIKVNTDGSFEAPVMNGLVVSYEGSPPQSPFKVVSEENPGQIVDMADYHILVTPIALLFSPKASACQVVPSVSEVNRFGVNCYETGTGTLKAVPFYLLIVQGG